MTDKLDITLRIGDVTLNLTINRNEEQILRDAAKEVNHAYEQYQKRFGSNISGDKEAREALAKEVMAKVTLLFAKGYLTMASQAREFDKTLSSFEASLDELLLK